MMRARAVGGSLAVVNRDGEPVVVDDLAQLLAHLMDALQHSYTGPYYYAADYYDRLKDIEDVVCKVVDLAVSLGVVETVEVELVEVDDAGA